ncbi:MAG: hypothetical protein JNL67_12810 [Planctomycetaceae bacterium]|nr:hypothetical protein [Planctomycetaceae bacterium]
MSSFFETDRDEFAFGGKIYQGYFNLYPNFSYKPTLRHIDSVSGLTVVGHNMHSDGWAIAVDFCNTSFLIDTHDHGTSTLFCVESGVNDQIVMLAFLGCFLPVLRDDWFGPSARDFKDD